MDYPWSSSGGGTGVRKIDCERLGHHVKTRWSRGNDVIPLKAATPTRYRDVYRYAYARGLVGDPAFKNLIVLDG